MKQNSELEGLGVSAEKLQAIFEKFSDRCLLILDGLDEHGLGQNEDVLKIIRGEKFLDCGIVVSSRPHSTTEVVSYFRTVVKVDGFNSKEAEMFASNFFKRKNKLREIMSFRPSDSREQFPIQQCPILLSFFCFLVAEKEIDLADKTVSLGDIYTHLVKCLYKKFTIRKGIAFKPDDFDKVLKFVGQLSLRTLTSNNPLLQRLEVLKVVGDFAFEYGVFAGHEDLKLFNDPTADIYVTYPHRSLEEFFGSYGFVQALNEGQSIDDILGSDCKEPIFVVNPLVLSFCLWVLSSSEFYFPHRDECYDKLTSYVAERIDSKVFDTNKISERYPAIDMLLPPAQSERLKIKFFHDILSKCKHVTSLHVHHSQLITIAKRCIEQFFELTGNDLTDRMTTIIIGDDAFKLKEIDHDSLILSIDSDYNDALQTINLMLRKYNLSKRNPQVYLRINGGYKNRELTDITPFLRTYSIQELCTENHISGFGSLTASGAFSRNPRLTHLTFQNQHIEESVPMALRTAIHVGKLPSLRHVTLIECCERSSRLDWPSEGMVSVKANVLYCGHCSK